MALFDLVGLAGAFGSLEKRLVHLVHSPHGHDRWNQGYDLVGVVETLTWAERGMPLSEHNRTPLFPSSDRERTAPDLIFLDARRVRWTEENWSVRLRIAWK
ncbi:uncharacterized protein BP5553_04314 [Venustampulla echinocandica]|uniref:Uncharacterized protein n=1 Tax=Venustampulla echinocandica TaxID=2656787 RepID=A0A370TWR6_9HELO|nr:uncharacterized protein BP5553_04314 [Venustampulla echinocandica]RDL39974.1 hypothetical protein BP5553_04314 [Venustampulla echinocandica]